MKVQLSDHAKFEAKRRGISTSRIIDVAKSPQQTSEAKNGRIVCQSKLLDDIERKEFVFRVIAKDIGDIRKVITVYKTSKIDKYWKSAT